MSKGVNMNAKSIVGIGSSVTVVMPAQTFKDGDHGFTRLWGICTAVCNSTKLSMAYGRLDPGVEATAHSHEVETAIYILRGAVRVLFGGNLEYFYDAFAGCFVHIPAGVQHKPILLSNEPMEYVVARDSSTPD